MLVKIRARSSKQKRFGARDRSSTRTILSVSYQDKGLRKAITLDSKPIVIILAEVSNEPRGFQDFHCDKPITAPFPFLGGECIHFGMPPPNVIWVYFRERLPLAIVKFRGDEDILLETDISEKYRKLKNFGVVHITGTIQRYKQYQANELWPKKIVTDKDGFLYNVELNNGIRVQGFVNSVFLRLEDMRYNPVIFWRFLHRTYAGRLLTNSYLPPYYLAPEKAGLPIFKDAEIEAIYSAIRKACATKPPPKILSTSVVPVIKEKEFIASEEFSSLNWIAQKKQYLIKGKAKIILEELYRAQKAGLPGLHQRELASAIYSYNEYKWRKGRVRVQYFFRTSDAKRLWRDGFITHDGKGIFHLNTPIRIDTH